MVDDETIIDQSAWRPEASVTVLLDGEPRPWAQRKPTYAAISHVSHLILSALPDGTVTNNPSVAMCVEVSTSEGDILVVAEVTLAALLSALDAIVVAYGDPREAT